MFFSRIAKACSFCQESISLTICADENPVARGAAPRVVEGISIVLKNVCTRMCFRVNTVCLVRIEKFPRRCTVHTRLRYASYRPRSTYPSKYCYHLIQY